MKYHQLFASMIAVSMLAVACQGEEAAQPSAPAGPAPKIQFDKTVYDFGSTQLVQKLAGTFIISNAGNAPLELKTPTTTCGCTLAGLKTNNLAPGDKTELAFTLNVGTHGHVEKGITVPSNDPLTPSVKLTLKADIIAVYDFNPQHLAVGDLRVGTTTNFTIQVKRNDGKPLGITKVVAGTPNVHATLEPVEGKPEAGTVRVEVVADATAGRFNSAITMLSEDGKPPVVTVPVVGRVVGDISLQQEAIFWGIPDPEKWPGQMGDNAVTRRIEVKCSLPDQKLELTDIISSLADVKVTVLTSPDGKTELVARLEKAPKESERGTITFATNVKSQPKVEIPVTIYVGPGKRS